MYQNSYFDISKKWKKGSYKSIKTFQKKVKEIWKKKKTCNSKQRLKN